MITSGGLVAQLGDLTFLSKPRDRCLVYVFGAAFDDSGTHDESPIVVVGGAVALVTRWIRFESEWLSALKDLGILDSPTPYFHMTDFANSQGVYADWQPEKLRQERFAKLLGIIERNVMSFIGVAMPRDVYEAAVPDAVKKFMSPYQFAAIGCLSSITNWIREYERNSGEECWCEYVFENMNEATKAIDDMRRRVETYAALKSRLRWISLAFRPKLEYVPLQAADIAAYEMYKEVPQVIGDRIRPTRYPFRALAQMPGSWGYFGAEEIRALVPFIREVFGL